MNTPTTKRKRLNCSDNEDDIDYSNLDYSRITFCKQENPSQDELSYRNFYLSNKKYKKVALCALCYAKGITKPVSTIGGSTSGLKAHLEAKIHKNESKFLIQTRF